MPRDLGNGARTPEGIGAMKAGALRVFLISASLFLPALFWIRDGAVQETGTSLRNELEALASQHSFTISGINKLEDEPANLETEGSLDERLGSLLSGYSYLLFRDATGEISKLGILGPHPSAEELEQRVSVKTMRRGDHHLVETILVGPRGTRRTLPLVVDTGASTVVLPSSMMEELGFKPSELQDGETQTAAGPVNVKLGQLDAVQVGHAHLRNVAVGFIEDDQIGEQHLLGMSFLGRFRLTIDDKNNRVMLSPR
jgi:aspartyl protease family protein